MEGRKQCEKGEVSSQKAEELNRKGLSFKDLW